MNGHPFIAGDVVARSLNRVLFTCQGEQLRGYPALSGILLDKTILAQFSADYARSSIHTFFNTPPTTSGLTIAAAHGHKFGCLLHTLKRGERAAQPEWNNAQLDFWRRVERVLVGGGQMSGWFGERVTMAANAVLANGGLTVERSRFTADIVLVGLARSAPPAACHALLFDFGQTTVKCALATIADNGVLKVERLFRIAINCDYMETVSAETAQTHWETMTRIIEHGLSTVPRTLRDNIPLCISLACYLQNGHPHPIDHGCYGQFQLLTNHLATFMQQTLAHPLMLTHDGTAAAAAHPDCVGVILTLGTAIGIGFPTETVVVHNLAETFAVRDKI